MQSPQATRAGYTIVELAIVMVIAGILMTLVIWRAGPALERARARQAIAVVAADLQYAQMVAARQREPVVVVVNPSLKLILVSSRGGTIFRQRFVGPQTEFGLETLQVDPTTSIEIFPNGAATSNLSVTAETNGFRRQVRMSRAGQIRILAP
jgi:prepilin-type N-terminal cleavage/methylation domain-containing protein